MLSDSPLGAEQVSVRFKNFTALDRVNFTICAGKVTGIAGPNGSGKTTLLRALFGAQPVTEGRIILDGSPLQQLSTAQIGQKIAVVSQFEDSIERIRVSDLVLLGRAAHRRDISGYSREDHEICDRALHKLGLFESKNRYLNTLSGGERQRVLIARALAQDCPYILLDEPTNHLDIKYQHQILQLIRSLNTTVVVILHDLNLLARYCDNALILSKGKVVSHGPVTKVLTKNTIREIYDIAVTEINDEGTRQFLFH